jgi:hypothetical protein
LSIEETFFCRDERSGHPAGIQNQIDSLTEFPTLYPLGGASRGFIAAARQEPEFARRRAGSTGSSLLSAFGAESLNRSLNAQQGELRSAGELA